MEAEEHQDVVVYDQSTRDVTGLAADSFLSILLGKLDSCFHSVSILTGRSPGLPLHLTLMPLAWSYGAVATLVHLHLHPLSWPLVVVVTEGSLAHRLRKLKPPCIHSLHRPALRCCAHQSG